MKRRIIRKTFVAESVCLLLNSSLHYKPVESLKQSCDVVGLTLLFFQDEASNSSERSEGNGWRKQEYQKGENCINQGRTE